MTTRELRIVCWWSCNKLFPRFITTPFIAISNIFIIHNFKGAAQGTVLQSLGEFVNTQGQNEPAQWKVRVTSYN